MKVTHAAIVRGFAKLADARQTKTAASKRWLEDSDLMKLCKLCKNQKRK